MQNGPINFKLFFSSFLSTILLKEITKKCFEHADTTLLTFNPCTKPEEVEIVRSFSFTLIDNIIKNNNNYN